MTATQSIALYELLFRHTNDKAKSLKLLKILNEEPKKSEKQIVYKKIEIQCLEYLGLLISIFFLTLVIIYLKHSS